MTNRVNGLAYPPMNSHVAGRHELVDLAVGQPPHELLVLLQPLRRELAHDQVPVVAVCGRVHGGDLVAERQLVAVLLDQLAHVVRPASGTGKPGNGPVTELHDEKVSVSL